MITLNLNLSLINNKQIDEHWVRCASIVQERESTTCFLTKYFPIFEFLKKKGGGGLTPK